MQQAEEIAIDLLIEAIRRKYGYDFRHYQRSTIKNRFEKYRNQLGLSSISEIIPVILRDRERFEELLLELSVTVTEMFRDSESHKVIRKKVIPQLKTYPYINAWHAGCATGEEAYSMAILLKEEAMLHRTQIYATDINDRSLRIAQKGIYPLHEMKRNTANYNRTGGEGTFTDYYHVKYKSAKMNQEFIDSITFSRHNLVTDGVFAEMQLIVCKNVLIYFDQHLQNRVLKLFADSLCHNGFLCLGNTESLEFLEVHSQFEFVDDAARIYRKKII
ncbi:MAG: protein-glutamate O-methyltransferase CheR [Bacteroidota bacterium]